MSNAMYANEPTITPKLCERSSRIAWSTPSAAATSQARSVRRVRSPSDSPSLSAPREPSARRSFGLSPARSAPNAVIRAGTSVRANDRLPDRMPRNAPIPTTISAKKFAALVTTKNATVRRAM